MSIAMEHYWTTFERDKNQHVNVAYRWDPERDRIVRRIHDRGDNTVEYESSRKPPDIGWVGTESHPPFDGLCVWMKEERNPFHD